MKIHNYLKKNSGGTIVAYAMMLSMIIGICAIVVDIGRVVAEKSRFQNALDAAALAAVVDLPDCDKALETAITFIEKNGFCENDITVTFPADYSEIHIQGSKKIDYFFARIMDFDTITIMPKASAAGGSIGHAFDYALFSGSTNQELIINGQGTEITGSIHTNKNFRLNGGKVTITGACEAVGNIIINGNNVNIGYQIEDAEIVEMPDFTDIIEEQATSCGTYYHSNKVYDGNVNITSSIYVDGEINVNSSRFSGTGCILAENSIVFNGSCLYSAPDDAVCFYSNNGNIIFNGSNAEIHGIIYAPNGTVIFNGSNQTVYGRIIAKNLIFNGSGLTVVAGNEELKSLPSKGARLIQ